MAKATLLFYDREDHEDGYITELRIWQLPEASVERPHGLKYSLFHGRAGERLVGYDNELGKGDHRHYGATEEKYVFQSVRKLLSDFKSDVARIRRFR